MEMQVYISNLGKYNEGELVGAWFTPPIDPEDVKEKIGLNSEYEEYAIHDYELPFDINEYISIEDINRLCALAEELSGSPIESEMKEIQQAFLAVLKKWQNTQAILSAIPIVTIWQTWHAISLKKREPWAKCLPVFKTTSTMKPMGVT